MRYTKFQNSLPREHRNTPWAENDPDFRMSRFEKGVWFVVGVCAVFAVLLLGAW